MLGEQPVEAGDADVVEPVDVLPMTSAETAASSATGRSAVPAAAMRTVPLPGSGGAAEWVMIAGKCRGTARRESVQSPPHMQRCRCV